MPLILSYLRDRYPSARMNSGDNHEHSHSHHHHHSHGHPIVKNMVLAFLINAAFTVIEFIGGILFNSTAILADAVHDLGDTIALGSTILIEKKSYKQRTDQFTFGYRRLSVLSGLINGIILISGSVIMASRAIHRILDPQEVNSVGMIGMAILGVIFNGIAVLSMKKSHKGINARALYLHLLEDALGWIAVLLGAIAIYLFDLPIIDPILSLALSLFIIYNAVKLLIPVYHILMESAPKDVDLEQLKSQAASISGLIDLHDIHIWSLDGEYHLLAAHALIGADVSKEESIIIKKKLIDICKQHRIYHTTLEIEVEGEECLGNCDD